MQDAVTVQQPTAEIKQTRIKTKTIVEDRQTLPKDRPSTIARTCQDR
jgi:hypothetical protein